MELWEKIYECELYDKLMIDRCDSNKENVK